jgi:hypothetical protein
MEILRGWGGGRGWSAELFKQVHNREIVYTIQDYMDSSSELKNTFDLLFRF